MPTQTINDIPEPTVTEISKSNQYHCWAELIGYPCCAPNNKKVYDHDSYGDWGFNFKTNEWCGITAYEEPVNANEECWSEIYGYPCCKGCTVYETDSDGKWGYEHNQWCGIPSYC
ncbi:Non-catalytic module family DOC2 [Piromyces sp. E2]|nr:Non-catalytic module family DOC2 [Piromyces sp. E2]|eukprot:OUM64371.1 Non-catalytic module family DOC2 [Piromyces sp. E2]